MDGASAAASVVSLVTILIQTTRTVQGFWLSVKDVPKRLQWLSDDLEIIQGILEHMTQQSSQRINTSGATTTCKALEKCAVHLSNLESLVAPLQSRFQDGGRKRIWGSIKTVLHADKIELYQKDLVAAKSILVLAQTSLNRFILESGIEEVLASQRNAVNNATAEHERIHGAISSLQQDIQMIAKSLPSNDTMTPFLTTTLEKTILPMLETKIAEYSANSGVDRPLRQVVLGHHYRAVEKQNTCTLPDTFMDLGVPRQKMSVVKGQRCIFMKYFSTPFGHVSIRGDIVYRNWTTKALCNESRVLEFGFAFIPRLMLSGKAFYITGIWDLFPHYSLTAINLQFRPIIESSSAIFSACRAGDIDTMKYLFQTRQTSPGVINNDGEDLILAALYGPYSTRYDVCNFLLNMGCEGTHIFEGEGEHLLDRAFYVIWPNSFGCGTNLFESDLKVIRLLMESGKSERINPWELIMSLVLISHYSVCCVPPALEYLCKQEFFDFSLRDSFALCRSVAKPFFEGRALGACLQYAELSSFLRTFFACGGDVMTLTSTDGESLIDVVLSKWLFLTFDNPREQRDEFNSAVIAFSLFLKYGYNPSTKFLVGDNIATAAIVARMDTDFTYVAWKLALKLNGWDLPDDGSADINENEGTLSETSPDQEKAKLGEDVEIDQQVPGAWTDEEEPEIILPSVRKFRSRPEDFTSEGNAVIWDPSLYIKSR